MYNLEQFKLDRDERINSRNESVKNLQVRIISNLKKNNITFDARELGIFINNICDISYIHHGLSGNEYLIHPFRVANIIINKYKKTDLKTVKIALAHNIIEVSNNTEEHLKDILSDEIYDYVQILTVDRAKQWNSEYKSKYYTNIKYYEYVAVVKIIDKYDNMFTLYKNPCMDTKTKYLKELELYILPLTKKVLPDLYNEICSVYEIIKNEIIL